MGQSSSKQSVVEVRLVAADAREDLLARAVVALLDGKVGAVSRAVVPIKAERHTTT